MPKPMPLNVWYMCDGIFNSMGMSLSKLREIVKDKRSLACCSPCGRKQLDTTEQLNSNNKSTWIVYRDCLKEA